MSTHTEELLKIAKSVRKNGITVNRAKETLLLSKEAKLTAMILLAKKARMTLEI